MTTHGVPTFDGPVLLTDSGLETDLIFGHGWDLPEFASFPLLDTDAGRAALLTYYQDHVDVALKHQTGFVFETPTWRASRDWGQRLGYDAEHLDDINTSAVLLLRQVRDASPSLVCATISGNLGPRGDGYVPSVAMTSEESRAYHARQIDVLHRAGSDVVTALTLNYAAEGLGIAQAAKDAGSPVILSFTVETDGSLPDGSRLADAIAMIDEHTDGYVSFYGLNCAHPGHMIPAVAGGAAWTSRIGAVRANASKLSHAELDALGTIDAGNPGELASDYDELRSLLPNLTVFGGCCGTDVRHVSAIANVIAPF
jgi:homocysteine S-methyltransferase